MGVRKTKLQPCAWLADPGGGKVLLKLESEQARHAEFERAEKESACVLKFPTCNSYFQLGFMWWRR